jgi:hypothetical protein
MSNNYSSVTNANSNFINNANAIMNSNTNNVFVDQSNQSESDVNAKVKEKKDALALLERDYLATAKIMNANLQNNFKSDIFLENQNREIEKNKVKMEKLKEDILTLRRQIDIGENEFLHKSYKIFFLKHIFIFCLLGVLVGLLYKNNNITMQTATMIIIGLAIFFSLLFFYNVFIYRFRNVNDFHRMDWSDPTK